MEQVSTRLLILVEVQSAGWHIIIGQNLNVHIVIDTQAIFTINVHVAILQVADIRLLKPHTESITL